ncbi:hypothetical protein [Streptosporangium sp. NPDC002524]|uniref:hypothetical protein n=1 Tax=Streptosporangium sp. NPDC002524 TaxID=3154537 RepID=UPI00331EDB2C
MEHRAEPPAPHRPPAGQSPERPAPPKARRLNPPEPGNRRTGQGFPAPARPAPSPRPRPDAPPAPPGPAGPITPATPAPGFPAAPSTPAPGLPGVPPAAPTPARSRPTPPQRRQPPGGGGQWTPGPLRTFPDEQVWPPKPPVEEPAEEEPPGASTQPFPSVPGPPLPRPSATGTGTAAATASPPGERPPPETAETTRTGAATAATTATEETSPPRSRRTALRVGGAIVAVGLGLAISAWSGYTVYRTGNPADRIYTVAPGGAMTLMHVSWKASVEQVDSLPGQKPLPADRQWLKIKVTRTALDAEGVSLRGEPEVEIRHSDGRAWKVLPESNDLPQEAKDHRVGTAYSYDMVGVVPRKLAGQVEVHVRPATYRVVEDQSVKDIFKEAAKQKDPVQDQVLRFRR